MTNLSGSTGHHLVMLDRVALRRTLDAEHPHKLTKLIVKDLDFYKEAFSNPDAHKGDRGFAVNPGGDLLSHGEAPHYHRRYTVSLLSSAWDQVVPVLSGRQEKGWYRTIRRAHRAVQAFGLIAKGCDALLLSAPKILGCYMVKPHGQLVQVSFTGYPASTPCLSTSSSSTDL